MSPNDPNAAYAQNPAYGQSPAQPAYGQNPYAPATAPAAAPSQAVLVVGLLAALGAMGLGAISFLIAGFEGHHAGWEMLAIPTLLAMMSALVGGIAGIVAITRKQTIGGLAAIGLSGFGVLLGLVGFVLGA
jgi:hypothetical protein